jgi:hypothetical protein
VSWRRGADGCRCSDRAVDDGVVLELPQRAQRADGLSGMSPLGKLKVESGKWKVSLSTFHFSLFT